MSALTALASFILYQAQVIYSGNYGWATLFHHSFIDRLLEPAKQNVSVSFGQYLDVLQIHSHALVMPETSYSLLLFILLNLLALKLLYKQPYLLDKKFQTLIITLVFMCAHWLIFPSQKERVLAGSFVFILLMLAVGIQERRNAAPGRIAEP